MSGVVFKSPATPDKQLAIRLQNVIRGASNGAPRSKQRSLGPSEYGTACVRRLAYRLLDWDRVNDTSDPWPSVSGTAIHAWLADAFMKDSSSEWLVEQRVTVRGGLSGTVDLYDVTNGVVIDHKCVGSTSMKARKESGPTHEQLVQVNLYAYGLKQAGYDVKKVALAFYPLGGMLTGLHVCVSDYDEQLALDAIERVDNVLTLVVKLDPEVTPAHWSAIPATPSRLCSYCPWFRPNSNDLSTACPGDSA